mgnify:FL=1
MHTMKPLIRIACISLAALALSTSSMAQSQTPSTSPAVAAKLTVRGEAPDTFVPEIRIARKGDMLSVQSDLRNGGKKDQGLFYRYRWLDQSGNQYGSGDSWKQLNLLSMSQQTIKGTAPHPSVSDFRLELSFESP